MCPNEVLKSTFYPSEDEFVASTLPLYDNYHENLLFQAPVWTSQPPNTTDINTAQDPALNFICPQKNIRTFNNYLDTQHETSVTNETNVGRTYNLINDVTTSPNWQW